MKLKASVIVGVLVVLAACGQGKSPDDVFDAAVEGMSMAYFSHVPEAATQLGMSDESVPGANRRMMDRSIAGNAARVAALEAARAER